MSVNIVNILAIYDINTLFERGQARDSVPVPSVNARSESPDLLLHCISGPVSENIPANCKITINN